MQNLHFDGANADTSSLLSTAISIIDRHKLRTGSSLCDYTQWDVLEMIEDRVEIEFEYIWNAQDAQEGIVDPPTDQELLDIIIRARSRVENHVNRC